MRTTRMIAGLFACTVLMLAGCKEDEVTVKVTGVELNKPAATLMVGQTETLTATVTPADATDKSVTWSSDDSTVVTVADGVVTAVAEGVAMITVKTVDGGKTASCTVTVTPAVSNVLDAITDPNFKVYAQFRMDNEQEGEIYQEGGLVTETFPKWDTDEDGELSLTEAAAVTYIGVGGGYPAGGENLISSLAGLEFFTGLNYLDCSDNSLAAVDVDANTSLIALDCSDNSLTAVDVAANASLAALDCSGNSLTALDVDANTSLNVLLCYNNLMTAFDATSMAFISETEYELQCGEQTSDGTAVQELTLTLREDQDAYWESDLKDRTNNVSVVLAPAS